MKKYLSLFAVILAVISVLCAMTAVSVFADEPAGGEGSDPVPPCENNDHTYDNACDAECNVCKATRSITHEFDNECDTDCNVCGTTRPATHKYDNACDKECNICKTTRETTHKYDNNCDTECNVCKETRTITHTYDNDCDKDCNVCNKTRTTSHKYDNDEDPECNVCKETREIPTAFEKWWDANNQWLGYVVAGIIFVGGAVGVYFWIPKNTDPKKKTSRK